MKHLLFNLPALLFTLVPSLIAENYTENCTENRAENWAKPELVKQVTDGIRSDACVSWWGYDREDSTRFLQAAIDSGAKQLTIDRQDDDGETLWITLPLKGTSNQEIVLEDGVVLMAKKDAYHGLGDSLLTFKQCENVTIRGEKQGEKQGAKAVLRMRKADYQKEPYKPSEWRHALSFFSSRNVQVHDLTIEYSGGDGIYLGVSKRGVTNENVTIRRVDCNENHRQGISVISAKNLLIEDSIMRNTNGTAPQSGIDFEPNREDEEITNCVMRRCTCENNAGDGFQFYLPNLTSHSPDVSVLLEECISRNNRRYGLFWMPAKGSDDATSPEPLRGSLTVRKFATINDGRGGIYLRNCVCEAGKVVLDRVLVRRQNQDESAEMKIVPIQLRTDSGITAPTGNVDFHRCFVEGDFTEENVIQIQNMSEESWGTQGIQGEIVIHQNGAETTLTLDGAWIQKYYPMKNTRHLPTLPIQVEKLASAGNTTGKVEMTPMTVRHQARYFLTVKEPGKVTARLRLVPVGKVLNSAKPATFTVTSPAGKNVCTTTLPILDANGRANETTLEFTADVAGIYTLETQMGAHAVRFETCTAPVALDARRVNWMRGAGTVYFNVPKDTKEFGLVIRGEGAEAANATVIAPTGEVVFQKDMITETEFIYPDEKLCRLGGMWTVEFSAPASGCFEDSGFTIQNVLPVLSFTPDGLVGYP